MIEPTDAQMEALEKVLSGRRGLRQELDEIRNVADERPEIDGDDAETSDPWIKTEYPIVIDIMRAGAKAVLNS